MGRVDKSRAAQAEALTARRQFDQVKASTTSAEASAKQAQTTEEQRKFEQEQYPAKFKLEERKVAADELRARSDAANAGRKGAEESIINNIWSSLKARDPKATYMDAFNAFQSGKGGGQRTSREEAIKNLDLRLGIKFKMMKPEDQEGLIRQEMGAAPSPKPSGGTNPYSTKSDAEIKAALGIK
jgi:hypothetical protein